MTMTPEMEVATKYQSHLAPLLACLMVGRGPVLEIGVGYFSTPQLHAFCGAASRVLVSVENDDKWRREFGDRLASKSHLFTQTIPNDCVGFNKWGVVFIDHSPGGKNRADAFAKLIPISDYVVVHDYHDENEEAIKPLLDDVRHYVCGAVFPPTLVASKYLPIPPVLIGM